MKKAFYDAIHSHAKDLAKHSDRVAEQFDPETIHKLRTTYKKLRALLRWQKIDKKIYAPFRKIYHLAGEIRIMQVAKEMLGKANTTPASFNGWLSSKLRDKKNEWNKLYNEKILQHLRLKLENLETPIHSHKTFFSKRIAEIHSTINAENISDEMLHDIRKMVKDMQYVLENCRKNCQGQIFPKSMTASRLKAIGKQIGSYNDTRIMGELLADFVQQKDGAALSNTTYSFMNKWYRKKEMQKKKLVRKLAEIDFKEKSKVKNQNSKIESASI